MDRLIRVKVDGHHLSKDHRTAGVQHEANAAKMRIEFDPSWDEYAKKITFWNADGKKPVERMLTADLLENMAESTRVYRCFIPGEAMTEAGDLTFIIDGYVDGKRQRSVSDTLEVEPAPYIEQADQPADPTPTQAEQLQVQINSLLNNVQASAIRAVEAAEVAERARDASLEIVGGDYVTWESLNGKADLVNGKVPAEQLPEAAPVKHADRHKPGGDDPLVLTAADVGAIAANGNKGLGDGVDLVSLVGRNGWYLLRDGETYLNAPTGFTGWGAMLLLDKTALILHLNRNAVYYNSNLSVPSPWAKLYSSANLTELRDALKSIW